MITMLGVRCVQVGIVFRKESVTLENGAFPRGANFSKVSLRVRGAGNALAAATELSELNVAASCVRSACSIFMALPTQNEFCFGDHSRVRHASGVIVALSSLVPLLPKAYRETDQYRRYPGIPFV